VEEHPVKGRRKDRKTRGARIRFEVSGRRYEGTVGEVTERYTADRKKAGVEWPGGISRPGRPRP
jgi:hypothetical protein